MLHQSRSRAEIRPAGEISIEQRRDIQAVYVPRDFRFAFVCSAAGAAQEWRYYGATRVELASRP